MKKEILKLLKKHSDIAIKVNGHKVISDYRYAIVAQKIEDHLEKFIEWVIYSDDIETYCSGEDKWFQIKGEDATHYTLLEIYDYWINNIC
jgi:hypothetical protein